MAYEYGTFNENNRTSLLSATTPGNEVVVDGIDCEIEIENDILDECNNNITDDLLEFVFLIFPVCITVIFMSRFLFPVNCNQSRIVNSVILYLHMQLFCIDKLSYYFFVISYNIW